MIWIALTTAVASAVMTYLSYRQTESTLTGYNQTATDLDNILSWWTSLEPEEQALRENVATLATHTEQVLADELSSWTQRMTDALEKLRETQAEKDQAKRAAAVQEEQDRQAREQALPAGRADAAPRVEEAPAGIPSQAQSDAPEPPTGARG